MIIMDGEYLSTSSYILQVTSYSIYIMARTANHFESYGTCAF